VLHGLAVPPSGRGHVKDGQFRELGGPPSGVPGRAGDHCGGSPTPFQFRYWMAVPERQKTSIPEDGFAAAATPIPGSVEPMLGPQAVKYCGGSKGARVVRMFGFIFFSFETQAPSTISAQRIASVRPKTKNETAFDRRMASTPFSATIGRYGFEAETKSRGSPSRRSLSRGVWLLSHARRFDALRRSRIQVVLRITGARPGGSRWLNVFACLSTRMRAGQVRCWRRIHAERGYASFCGLRD